MIVPLRPFFRALPVRPVKSESVIRAATSGRFFIALIAVAVLVNAAGYLFTLWHDETVFDELVHFYTTFSGVAGIGRLALEKWPVREPFSRWWALLAIGLALGILWEIFEWTIGIIGNRRDTLIDLAMDVIGAATAAAFIKLVKRQSQFEI